MYDRSKKPEPTSSKLIEAGSIKKNTAMHSPKNMPSRYDKKNPTTQNTLSPDQLVQVATSGLEAFKEVVRWKAEIERTTQIEAMSRVAIRKSDNETEQMYVNLESKRISATENIREIDSRTLSNSQKHEFRMTDLAGRHQIGQQIMQKHAKAGTSPSTEELALIATLYSSPEK